MQGVHGQEKKTRKEKENTNRIDHLGIKTIT